MRRSVSSEGDIVALSSVNFYDGVTREEVEKFYSSLEDPDDPCPVSIGLNSKVVKEDGTIKELTWKSGGLYGQAIDRICSELGKAMECAENDVQRKALGLLIDYYHTGDLRL